MSSPINVGDTCIHAEFGSVWIGTVKIVRETTTQWIDSNDRRWRKSDRAPVRAMYGCGSRSLMTLADFAVAGGKVPT